MKAQKKNCCDNNNSDTNLKNLLYKYNIKRQLSQIEATIRSFEYEYNTNRLCCQILEEIEGFKNELRQRN